MIAGLRLFVHYDSSMEFFNVIDRGFNLPSSTPLLSLFPCKKKKGRKNEMIPRRKCLT